VCCFLKCQNSQIFQRTWIVKLSVGYWDSYPYYKLTIQIGLTTICGRNTVTLSQLFHQLLGQNIDYFQNGRSRITEEKLYVEKDVISAMEQSLENKWFRDFSALQLTSDTVVMLKCLCFFFISIDCYICLFLDCSISNTECTYYPWVACSKDGMVQFVHCTCTTG